MIIQALADYYDVLSSDHSSLIPQFGFSRERISFSLILDLDGTLMNIVDLRENSSRGMQPIEVNVPDRGSRSGKGLKPNFLWDNSRYVLGRGTLTSVERSTDAINSFREFHCQMLECLPDDGLSAICRFVEAWNPDNAEKEISKYISWQDVQEANLIFQIRGRDHYVHQSCKIKEGWPDWTSRNSDASCGICSVTGAPSSLVRLHHQIKGVSGSLPSGTSLTSFNQPAFDSYGKSQGLNAPIGLHVAFKYSTALNHLLARSERKVFIGDMTIIWWSAKPTRFEEHFRAILDATFPSPTTTVTAGIFDFLTRESDEHENDIKFYILGLSPNASRLFTRAWIDTTIGELKRKLADHFEDLRMAGAHPQSRPISVRDFLPEIACDNRNLLPLRGGTLLSAALNGTTYPEDYYNALLQRIRFEPEMRYRRAAMIKAHLNRRWRLAGIRKRLGECLDVGCSETSYILGRFFAVMEKVQNDSRRGMHPRTIRATWLSLAASNPRSIFPMLLRWPVFRPLKLKRSATTKYMFGLDKFCDPNPEFPLRLGIEEQGMFFVGYHHQRQSFFDEIDVQPNSRPTTHEPQALQNL